MKRLQCNRLTDLARIKCTMCFASSFHAHFLALRVVEVTCWMGYTASTCQIRLLTSRAPCPTMTERLLSINQQVISTLPYMLFYSDWLKKPECLSFLVPVFPGCQIAHLACTHFQSITATSPRYRPIKRSSF